MAKLKTKLTINSFQATHPMPPLIPTPRIVLVDENSPIKKPGELPEDHLIHLTSELIITKADQQTISSISNTDDPIKDKGKWISFGWVSPVKKLSKNEGWYLDEMNQEIEESLQIQALKDNLNPLTDISPYYP